MIDIIVSDRLLNETRERRTHLQRFYPHVEQKDVIEAMMGDTTRVHGITEVDGVKMREAGCRGPCCCTGACKELVPLTEMDELDYNYYAIKLQYVTKAVEQTWNEDE